jgi:hypothetical protein
MPKRMFAPVAGCVIECCRWRAAAKGPVITDIGPDVALDRPPLRQNWDRSVVAVEGLGSEHMRFDQCVQRLQYRRASTDQVGQR